MQISIGRDGQQIGTWTEKEVREFYLSGQLVPTDYYWRDGMAEWEPLSSLCAAPPPTPPAPPIPTPPIQPATQAVVQQGPAITPIVPAHVPGQKPAKSGSSWLAWVVPLMLAFVISYFFGQGGAAGDPTAHAAAGVAGLIVFGGLAALISIPFPRSWRLAVRCLTVLILFGLVLVGKQQAARKKVFAEFQAFNKEQQEDAQRQIAKNGHLTPDPKKAEAEIEKLKQLSSAENGSDKKLTDEAVEMMQQISTRLKSCVTAEHEMLAMGLSPEKLTSLEEVDKRRAAVAACQPPIQDLITYLQNIEQTTRASLAAKGVTPTGIDQYIAGMHSTGKLQALHTYWQMEGALLADISARLDLFKDNWGKWHVENNKVVFQDDATLAAYNANSQKIHDDTAQQKAAQQETLKPTPTQ